MDRRKLLSIAGTAGLTSLAGCQVFSSVVRTGPPNFEEVEISGPNEVAVGEEFSLTVSAKNTGGEKGNFADTLAVGEGAFSSERDVEIEDVGVTKTESVDVGPYRVGYAGEYRFRTTDYGASHTVSVTTNTLGSGNELGIENGPTITVVDVTARPSVAYPTDDGREVLTPSSDRVLVFLHLDIGNGGDGKLRVGPDSFTIENGERIDSVERRGVSLKDLEIEGRPLSTDAVLPNESKSGWILAEVPPEVAERGVRISWNRDAEDTSPEARWTVEPAGVPRYEVREMNFPSEVEIGATAEGVVTIENAGSTSGTYYGVLERRNGDETEWSRFDTLSVELDAGSRESWSTTIEESNLGVSQYRLRPGSITRSVEFVPATRSFGESYTTPTGAKVVASVGGSDFDGFHASYTYEAAWDDRTVRAADGNTFAFFRIAAENVSDESIDFPSWDDFAVVVDSSTFSPEESQSFGTRELVSPVDGTGYTSDWLYTAGETESGWLVFEVPRNVSKNQLVLRCSPTKNVTAEWSEG